MFPYFIPDDSFNRNAFIMNCAFDLVLNVPDLPLEIVVLVFTIKDLGLSSLEGGAVVLPLSFVLFVLLKNPICDFLFVPQLLQKPLFVFVLNMDYLGISLLLLLYLGLESAFFRGK